jgi:hypothetical protein
MPIGGKILPVRGYRDGGRGGGGLVRITPGSSSFKVCGSSSSTKSSGTISGTWYLVPQPFAVGGKQAVSRFFWP